MFLKIKRVNFLLEARKKEVYLLNQMIRHNCTQDPPTMGIGHEKRQEKERVLQCLQRSFSCSFLGFGLFLHASLFAKQLPYLFVYKSHAFIRRTPYFWLKKWYKIFSSSLLKQNTTSSYNNIHPKIITCSLNCTVYTLLLC